MPKVYHCPIEVRGYELDSFGHVNHAVYVSYLEHARWKLLAEEGVTLQKMEQWKKWPIIARIEAAYLKPTYLGDTLTVETRLERHGRTSFYAHQSITRDGTPVLTAKVHVVIVNENGRPTDLPDELRELAQEPSS